MITAMLSTADSRVSAGLLLLVALSAAPLSARVVRVDISSRADVLARRLFNEAGTYERIVGRVYFSVATANEHNQSIVDLDRALNLKDGAVEFSSDFVAVQPKDVHQGNGTMLLEIPNRGHGNILSLVDGGDADLASDPGDGWLLRSGITIVTLGSQWDAPDHDALRLVAPIAKENDSSLLGLLRGELMPWRVEPEIPLGHVFLGGGYSR